MINANLLVRAVLIIAAVFATALVTSNDAYADGQGGTWTKKSQKIAGAWKIVERAASSNSMTHSRRAAHPT